MDWKGYIPGVDSEDAMREVKQTANKNREAFEAFDLAHPECYAEFCKRVNQLWERGIRHYSADSILHIIRFHSAIDGRPEDEYKINNNFSAFYSRKWQQDNPDRSYFFATRIQKSAQ